MSKISDTIRGMNVCGVESVQTYVVDRGVYPLTNGGRHRCGLFLTVEGDETYFCASPAETAVRTHPGTVFFLPQGASYRITLAAPRSDVRVIDFSLAGTPPEPFSLEVKNVGRLLSLFSEAERQWDRREPMSEMFCRSLIYEILSLIGAESDLYAPSRERRIVKEAAAYLHAHYTDRDFQIASLPKIAGWSHRYFNRVFFAEYGQTPKEYAVALRLSRAKELLLTEKLTVGAIAEALGYCDAFHFSKSFKRYTGLTPTQFRQTSGGE